MQKKTSQSPEAGIKQEIAHLLEQLDLIQKQSINRFDHAEVSDRAFQLLDLLDGKIHELNEFHKDPNEETARNIQDLFFHAKTMQETVENLKLDTHKLENQQQFIASIDEMKKSLYRL